MRFELRERRLKITQICGQTIFEMQMKGERASQKSRFYLILFPHIFKPNYVVCMYNPKEDLISRNLMGHGSYEPKLSKGSHVYVIQTYISFFNFIIFSVVSKIP